MVAEALREQAQRCRRLARSIYTQETAAELEAYARQLEQRAMRLEEEALRRAPDGTLRQATIGARLLPGATGPTI